MGKPNEVLRARIILMLLIGTVGAMTGCSTYPQIYRLTDQLYPSRPSDYPIFLSQEDVQESYIRIAVVRTSLYEAWAFERAAEAELQRMARRLDGDAVIEIKSGSELSESIAYSASSQLRIDAKPVGKFYYTGTVVRFHRPPIISPPTP